MPWSHGPVVAEFVADPFSCPECFGFPGPDAPECETCGAAYVAPDPEEFMTARALLTVATDENPRPPISRWSLQIQDGWRRQADGRFARVWRVIDKRRDRYIEKIDIDGVRVRDVDEPLSQHRGHGSAKRRA